MAEQEKAAAENPQGAAAPAAETAEKKHKKISRLTLDEIKTKLSALEKEMGGTSSKYAAELKKRKAFLEK